MHEKKMKKVHQKDEESVKKDEESAKKDEDFQTKKVKIKKMKEV